MEHKNDLLAAVEKPSRYLGTEVHRVLKDPGTVQLRIALAFPDLYEIGTSHFGLQILYHLLNAMPAVAAVHPISTEVSSSTAAWHARRKPSAIS